MQLSFAKLRELWEKLSQFEVLFTLSYEKDFGKFVSSFVREVMPDVYEPTGLFWQVDDVGILFITDIAPGYSASAHFTFWDKRFRGREKLVLEMMRYTFDLLSLHRMSVEIPMYMPALLAFAERIGFVKEGRKRKTHFYREKWYDSAIFSILEDEV
jgi:RimJ/RimL family protein N-acetyltransferase